MAFTSPAGSVVTKTRSSAARLLKALRSRAATASPKERSCAQAASGPQPRQDGACRSGASAIGDYAIIGDCGTAALVSRTGAIDWFCMPHFSGPSVFAAILDRKRGGTFSICPIGRFDISRRYVGPTAILETTFATDSGTIRLTDVMPMTPGMGTLRPYREILRIIEGITGEVVLDILCEPRPDYGRAKPRIRSRGALGHAIVWADELYMLSAEIPLQILPSREALGARIRVAAGQSVRFSLSYTKGDIGVSAPLGEAADGRFRDTLAWWNAWAGTCRYEGPHRDLVLRSAVTLKLMTFGLSGAVVAAPTTSLPEAIGGGRNYDYRFCWLRDAALTMKAFLSLGFREEATAFLHWLLHATRLTWPELQVMYDIHGGTDLEIEELTHLGGYGGSRPVRIGNDARDQLQLDVYAGVVSAALYYVQNGGELQADEAKLLAGLGATVSRRWKEPDHGIWEIPDPRRQYTFSKVMCWAAIDGLIGLHDRGTIKVDAARLAGVRDEIGALIESRGYSQKLASYVSELDGENLDAALLLMSCIGYKDASDVRMRRTFERIQERLGRGGFLYRYEDGYDGLPALEGAFGICSFWAVDNLAKRGDLDEAHRLLDHILSFANDVGLFAEQVDLQSGAALGNFPQAFTHVGLINAATALAAARRDAA